jgi:hypothetical protein
MLSGSILGLVQVRVAAGRAFDTLFRSAGAEVTSDIIPELLAQLETDPHALDGLKQVQTYTSSMLSFG